MNGILPLWKPKGYTSHDCVAKLRRMLKIKKAGHTGTLDPGVKGVLPICFGEATKIIPFLSSLRKVYIAEVFLGKATTTEDGYGEFIEEKEVIIPPREDEIDKVLERFTGEIEQIPPLYSAVKVKGKRLYEYAHEGKTVERPSRQVTIHHIERLPSTSGQKNTFMIKIICSKGTYIRTLCVDIGKALGYPAHMSDLKRVESDSFSEKDTFTFSEIEGKIETNSISTYLLPIERGLRHLDTLEVEKDLKQKVLHGQKLPNNTSSMQTNPFKVMYSNELLAIYEIHPSNEREIKPVRIFNIHKNVGE